MKLFQTQNISDHQMNTNNLGKKWSTVIICQILKRFYWGYLFPRPVQPAAYSASKEIFWSGWKIPLQSKHIWLRMWRHLPTFKGLPNIKALPSLSLSLFSISLLEHNTIRKWFLGKVSFSRKPSRKSKHVCLYTSETY